MRWIPFVAWILALTGLILSLVTLLSGIDGHSSTARVFATFNVSSLGMAEYHDPSSELGKNISDLVPLEANDPPSITTYLGVKDWYSMHYLSICSGYFAPSVSETSLLTSTKVNITCVRQSSGYTFSLANILRSELKPNIISLANQIGFRTKSYNTATWINLWYAGIAFAFLELLILPLTFSGKRRINMCISLLALVSSLLFDISSGLITGHALGIRRSGLGSYSTAFLGLTWASTACLLIVLCLIQIEWKYQIWTPVGQPIVRYSKPKDVSWLAVRPPGSRKMKSYWDVRHGI